MEDAADALKIAFAVFVFVIAISITFISISKAISTSDIVIHALDATNFYPTYDPRKQTNGLYKVYDVLKDENGNIISEIEVMELDENRNRIVEADTVISMLYRYHRESIAIRIINKQNKQIGRFDLNIEANAPWRLNLESGDKRIDYFIEEPTGTLQINGTKVKFGGSSGKDSGDGYYLAEESFKNYMGSRFREEFIEVNYNGLYLTGEDGTQVTITPGGKMIYITYTEI